jgi:hypothetical protein
MAGLLYRIPENDLMSLAEPVSKPSPLLTRLAVLLRNIPVVQFVLARLASLRGIPVARGESSEPASLGEQYRSSDRVAPDPSLAALPLVDPTVVRQALNDEPLAAAARDGVDQSAAHAAAADVTLSEPASIERTMDDALVDDPSLAFLLGVDQPHEAAEVVDDLPVAARAVDDQMAGDPSVLVPGVGLSLPSERVCAEPRDQRAERERLIRRRWMETGIKMWNPDFNGGARATLNIQGQAGLLPVQPGETISRYDTLQFKQVEQGIICEGVVVEAPRRRQ